MNDPVLDMDVFSSFPLMRLDASQQREWYHRYQHLYVPLLFPLLAVSVHMQDFAALRTRLINGVRMSGASASELTTFARRPSLCAPALLPWRAHGAAALGPYLGFAAGGSRLLSPMFIVSHNVASTKKRCDGPAADWAVAQIERSANWGGWLGCVLSGGLNLQIEHHLVRLLRPMCSSLPRISASVCVVLCEDYFYLQFPSVSYMY